MEPPVETDRQALELGVRLLADMVGSGLTEAHYADPAAQERIAVAAQCLQAAAGFLSSVLTDPEDAQVGALLGREYLQRAWAQQHTI